MQVLSTCVAGGYPVACVTGVVSDDNLTICLPALSFTELP